jgi:hypothetical protein
MFTRSPIHPSCRHYYVLEMPTRRGGKIMHNNAPSDHIKEN